MTEWIECTLDKLGEIVGGATPSTKCEDYYGGSIPWITPKDLSSFKGRYITSGERNITEKGLASCSAQMMPKDAVLFTSRAPIGYVAIASQSVCTNQGFKSIVVNEKADPLFVYYLLKYNKDAIEAMGSGTTFKEVSGKTMRAVKVRIPLDVSYQKRIAAVLDSLDTKIENNERINDNLEQQAQSYFQELFVDNADPEWTTGTISDLGAVVGGSTPSKAKPEYYTESGIAWITPKDLSINKSKFVSHGENDITELGLKNSSAAIMPEGTVLFSSRAPIGYIAIAAGEVTTNQGFKSVVPKPEIGTPFVYFFLKNTLPVIEGMASGSTFKEVSGSTMKNVPAVIPDAETLAKFSDFCAPIFAQQRILEEQNQSLATLRDNLLPKLMSGEIDVSAVQL
ncbi:restriction endonuclease subunit S [Flavonifractor plautii]|uniref:restriction endonuclease subunit S n=1 Tax=Flavonifractor plautii TaxID=292800 RepID=UPI0018AA139D|nr:restriction endonuclease subunit S [Flavonifractor plautii]